MGSKANPTVIGAFVVGAVVLSVAALLIFSGGKVLTKKAFYVMYFDSSVNGLNIGAPVKFKGVQIGEVTNISSCRKRPESVAGRVWGKHVDSTRC